MRVQFNFLARSKNEAQIASTKAQEELGENITELKWFTKEEIQKMDANEFISLRTYELLHDWILGKKFPLEANKQVPM